MLWTRNKIHHAGSRAVLRQLVVSPSLGVAATSSSSVQYMLDSAILQLTACVSTNHTPTL